MHLRLLSGRILLSIDEYFGKSKNIRSVARMQVRRGRSVQFETNLIHYRQFGLDLEIALITVDERL